MKKLNRGFIIFIGIGMGAAFWAIEAAVHTYVFHEGSLILHVTGPKPHEIWMRLIVMGLFVVFAISTQLFFNRQGKAEEAIRFAHMELNQIFQTSADGMRIVDKDFNVLRMNETFANMSGMEQGIGVGRKCHEVFSGSLCHTPGCPLIRILNGENRVECEVEKENAKGEKIPCILMATPFKDPDGNLLGIVEDFKDITELKKSEKVILASEKELHLLSYQLLTAQEKERKRLAIGLHDELGQALTVLKLKLGLILSSEKPRESLNEVVLYVDDIIDKTRRISKDLSPAILEDLGLLPALMGLIETNKQYFDIEAEIDVPEEKDFFSKENRIIIYRIVQECLTNIGKHANATHVVVSAKQQNGYAVFQISDNGMGFDIKEVFARPPHERGMGLAAMQERVRMLGGTLEMKSTIEEGTQIVFSVPCERRELK